MLSVSVGPPLDTPLSLRFVSAVVCMYVFYLFYAMASGGGAFCAPFGTVRRVDDLSAEGTVEAFRWACEV